ncbi:MAG: phosphoribosylformylglycinamidine cyclo-ligase [Bdellovibrionaceae bacterium]|nr:phosphoribosylformylglycinamidine cyclo-ligase [Pseudobdellovibrionaceae bacterium]
MCTEFKLPVNFAAMNPNEKTSYKSSGVDVEAGDRLVDWLQQTNSNKGPHHQQIVEGIGGFASLFRWPANNYKKPCLVTCTDGVGTKVKLAAQFDCLQGIGQDLVAMCVNDLICTGGTPLLFLDYYAVGQLNLVQAQIFLESVRRACTESQCALVGGETAEMPGVYQAKDFDCAGFAVGMVDEEARWGSHLVEIGDQIIALESSGFHSNGYSLLRRVFAEDAKDFINELMEPTRLYVQAIQALKGEEESTAGKKIKAVAHITGGGLENLPRVLPANTLAKIKAWPFPRMFQIVQERTRMTHLEMLGTLNCGVGMMVIVDPSFTQTALNLFARIGQKAWVCGAVSDQRAGAVGDQKLEPTYIVEGL